MYKLIFYVPEAEAEAVKNAVFEAGGGRLGNYECCAWQVLGEGQFKPIQGAKPFVGKVGSIHREKEYLVEILCNDDCIEAAVQAMKASHPYEEPAYSVTPLLPVD